MKFHVILLSMLIVCVIGLTISYFTGPIPLYAAIGGSFIGGFIISWWLDNLIGDR